MSTLYFSPALVFSEDELAKLTNLGTYELRKLHPDGFGVPGHWYLNANSRPCYTQKGAEAMVESLDAHGYAAAAVCLRAKLKSLRETPSLGMFCQAAKQTEHWFNKGQFA
jgi:hypothetical protein